MVIKIKTRFDLQAPDGDTLTYNTKQLQKNEWKHLQNTTVRRKKPVQRRLCYLAVRTWLVHRRYNKVNGLIEQFDKFGCCIVELKYSKVVHAHARHWKTISNVVKVLALVAHVYRCANHQRFKKEYAGVYTGMLKLQKLFFWCLQHCCMIGALTTVQYSTGEVWRFKTLAICFAAIVMVCMTIV